MESPASEGTPIDATTDRSSAERPPSDVGLKALGMVGVGIAVVLGLYAITQLSNRTPAVSDEQPAGGATSVEPSGAVLIDSLQATVRVLEAEGSANSWARIGHLYFTAAMQADEASRAEFAGRAVDAFELSLGIEEDADVRTSLAEAAQFDPRNPMRAVQELRAVLESSPDHLAANYLLGALRMRIGRLDGAAESFQRVIDLTPPTDPIHQRAQNDLQSVRAAASSME